MEFSLQVERFLLGYHYSSACYKRFKDWNLAVNQYCKRRGLHEAFKMRVS